MASGGYEDGGDLYVYDDDSPAKQVEKGTALPVYVLFLQRAGRRPLPNANFRGLSVWGADRTALMAGCFGQVVGKPYESKSDAPVMRISVGGNTPDEVYFLRLSRNTPPRVYVQPAQQQKAISLLRSSPVAAWRMVANNAWQLHEKELGNQMKSNQMSLGVINWFLDGMASCLPKSTGLALVTFCGSAPRSVAVRRLPGMFVESTKHEDTKKYKGYALILQTRVVPPGLLTTKEVEEYFPVGGQGVGCSSETWPPEKVEVLRRILSEGLLVQPGAEYRKVRTSDFSCCWERRAP